MDYDKENVALQTIAQLMLLSLPSEINENLNHRHINTNTTQSFDTRHQQLPKALRVRTRRITPRELVKPRPRQPSSPR
jgi:hypothetical protein